MWKVLPEPKATIAQTHHNHQNLYQRHQERPPWGMNTAAQRRMNLAFERAERQGRCLVPCSSADARWLQHAARRGEVLRPAEGLYARPDYWNNLSVPQRTLHVIRGLSQMHPDWVFAGCSAAVVHGLDVGFGNLTHVCLATKPAAHTKSGAVARRVTVSQDTPVIRQGIPVTSFSRTVGDCIRTLDFASALAIADSALRLKDISSERLEKNVCSACKHHPGLDRVRKIIRLADGRSENGGESKTRAQIIKLGFAVPDLQRCVHDPLDGNRNFRVDFAWDLPDGSQVLGELDGKDKYYDQQMTKGMTTEEVLLTERRRESRVTLGKRPTKIMRFSFAEACDDSYFARLLESYGIPHSAHIPSVALT